MSKHLLAALCAASLAAGAQAQTVATTLPGVTILGSTYDVTFTQGEIGSTSFNNVFGTGSPTLTFDAASAPAAVAQLLAAVAAASFDVTPGSDDPAAEVFILPFSYTATTFSYSAGWTDTPGNGFVGVAGPFANRARATQRSASFVTFAAPVPEPSAALLALAGMGLVMGVVAGARRRQGAERSAGAGVRP